MTKEINIKLTKISSKYRILCNYYTNQEFNLITEKNKELNNKLDLHQKQLKKIDLETKQRTNQVLSRLENIGLNIINLVVSFSIVSSAVVAIDKVEVKYLPIFLVSLIWLSLSTIMFISVTFKKNINDLKIPMVIYTLLTILEVLTIIMTVFFY